jgi:small subunit ribosomal protein S17e
VDRIKRLSMIVLKDNKAKFGVDFNENKKILDSLSTITSKALRNRVAGYITRLLKNESIELEKVENMKKQEQVEDQNEPEDLVTESVSEEAPLTETS